MARKSRRTHNTEAVEKKIPMRKHPELLATAAYGRLSVENSGYENDESIQTQMTMLYQYIEDHPELEFVDSYQDNGYTGTNFDRPEFARLMDDVRSGKVQCIVVKDLSRFGRDYLETGYYLETLFPHLNVRFIAITDDFDSSREEDLNSLAVPIKNMVNAMYAKDMSKKQCAAAKIRISKPDAMPSGTAPYGYRFSEDKKQYLVDPEAAPYIRMIFQWVLMGVSFKKIAKRLELLGAKTPGQLRNTKPQGATNKASWRETTVYKISKNPNYTGDVYLGRRRQALYKSESCKPTSPDEWIIRKNTHEPLVSRADYQRVQEIIQENGKKQESYRACHCEERERLPNHFPAMIYCAECGHQLNFVRYTHNYTTNKKSVTAYICPENEGKAACGGQIIYEDFLKIVAMDQIQVLIKSMCDYKKLLDKINTSQGGKNALLSAQKKMMALNVKIAEAEEHQATLYENYAEGLLDAEDYQSLKENYISSIQTMQEELRQLEQEKRMLERTINRYTELLKHLETYLDKREFNEKLVQELIERITVSKTGKIEVVFKCNDVYQKVVKIVEGSDSE
jgi:DNA invertase Pin-like site-specific DNA recombinase